MNFYLHVWDFVLNSNNTRELASISDVITVEIEHVNTESLESLTLAGHIVHPSPATIRLIQVCSHSC